MVSWSAMPSAQRPAAQSRPHLSWHAHAAENPLVLIHAQRNRVRNTVDVQGSVVQLAPEGEDGSREVGRTAEL